MSFLGVEKGNRTMATTGAILVLLRGLISAKDSYFRLSHIRFLAMVFLTAQRQCKEPRDRVYALLSLATDEFRNKITVSYTRSLSELYVETGQVCLLHEGLDYLNPAQFKPAGRLQVLPTWCDDLCFLSGFQIFFHYHARAGFVWDRYRHQVRNFSHTKHIDILGFRAERVDQVIAHFDCSIGWLGDTVAKFGRWLDICLKFAQRTIKGTGHKESGYEDDILVSHISAIMGTTITNQPDREAIKQWYCTLIDVTNAENRNLKNRRTAKNPVAAGGSSISEEITKIIAWVGSVAGRCQTRTYFTSTKGKVGVGPPDTKPGDTVAVLFGGRSVYVLRERDETQKFEFIGCAFVHGLMELSRSSKEDIGETEWFSII